MIYLYSIAKHYYISQKELVVVKGTVFVSNVPNVWYNLRKCKTPSAECREMMREWKSDFAVGFSNCRVLSRLCTRLGLQCIIPITVCTIPKLFARYIISFLYLFVSSLHISNEKDQGLFCFFFFCFILINCMFKSWYRLQCKKFLALLCTCWIKAFWPRGCGFWLPRPLC